MCVLVVVALSRVSLAAVVAAIGLAAQPPALAGGLSFVNRTNANSGLGADAVRGV